MKNPVVIFGAGNLGRIALDIFSSNEVLIYGFLDDNQKLHNTEISEVLVLGDPADDGFLKIIGNKTEAFVALENKTHKEKVVKMLLERRKTMPVNAIHGKAIVSEDAELGHGILIAAGAVINQGSKIGKNARIGAGSVVIEDVKEGATVFGNPAVVVGK